MVIGVQQNSTKNSLTLAIANQTVPALAIANQTVPPLAIWNQTPPPFAIANQTLSLWTNKVIFDMAKQHANSLSEAKQKKQR